MNDEIPATSTRQSKLGRNRNGKHINRDRILNATIESVILLGYARTSVSEVARRAGVTRPLVQYYFPTRDHMLRAAITHILEAWQTKYFLLPTAPESGAPDLAKGVQRLWQHMHDPAYSAYLELRSAARTDHKLGAILDEIEVSNEKRRHEQATNSYMAYASVDPLAFADARAFTTIFLEGLLQHRFGSAEESSTPARQLALLSKLLTHFWAQWGLNLDPVDPPTSDASSSGGPEAQADHPVTSDSGYPN